MGYCKRARHFLFWKMVHRIHSIGAFNNMEGFEAKKTGNICRRHPGIKKENLDGQICHGLPLCSDHSFLQPGSMVPLCSWAQLAIQETSVLNAVPHLQKHRRLHTGRLLFWDLHWEQTVQDLPDHCKQAYLYYVHSVDSWCVFNNMI